MTTPPPTSSSPDDQRPSSPVYAQNELYDSPADLQKWPELAPLLRSWHQEVWEKDHSQSRGCWYYDQEAIRLQERHKLVVIVGAVAGTAAVILAILQLGNAGTESLLNLEVACLVAAVITIVLGAVHSLDHRWRQDRFKAEQYRMLKFRFLHDATRWLAASESERAEHLAHYIARIHAANRGGIKDWIHWKKEILPVLETPETKLDPEVAKDLVGYFRQRRLSPQQKYFHNRGAYLHGVESIARWIGPGLFFASVIFALTHAVVHVLERRSQSDTASKEALQEPEKRIGKKVEEHPEGASKSSKTQNGHDNKTQAGHGNLTWAVWLALAAAILPVLGAGIRTWRGAFEYGRNSLRFEAMAHHLEYLLNEIDVAKTPEAKLALLRRGEHAMEGEHRAWMRLMMEAEWFG